MSYLKQFNQKVPNKGQNENSFSNANYNNEREGVVQAKFTFLKLSTYSAQSVISSLSQSVQALDFSHNKIEYFPSYIPHTIIGINLSHNVIESINIGKSCAQLIELNLSHNRITSTAGLAPLLNLEFLELSFNSISVIEGLENMKKLQVLKLQGNNIQVASSIRSLSCNKMLTDVDLSKNPFSETREFKLVMMNYIPHIKFLNKSPVRIRGAGVGYADMVPTRHPMHIDNNNMSFQSTELQKDQLIELWKEMAKDEKIWSSSIPVDILQRIKQLIPEEEQEQQSVETEQPEEPIIRNKNLPWRRAPNPLPRPGPPKKMKPKSPEPSVEIIKSVKKKDKTKKEKTKEEPKPQLSMLDEIIHDMDLSPQETIHGTAWMSPRLQKRKEKPLSPAVPPPIPPPSFQYITQWDIESPGPIEDGGDDVDSINTFGSSQNQSKYRTPNRSTSKGVPALPIDSNTYRLNLVDNAKHSPTRSSILRAKTIAKQIQHKKESEDDYKHRKTFATSPAPSRYKVKEKSTQVTMMDEEAQYNDNDDEAAGGGNNNHQDNNNNLLLQNQLQVQEIIGLPPPEPSTVSPFNRLVRLKEKIDRRLGMNEPLSEEEHQSNEAYRYLKDMETSLAGEESLGLMQGYSQDPWNHGNSSLMLLNQLPATPMHPLLTSSSSAFYPSSSKASSGNGTPFLHQNSFLVSPFTTASIQQDSSQLISIPDQIDVNTEGAKLSNALASLRDKKLRSLQSLATGYDIPMLHYASFGHYPTSSVASSSTPMMNSNDPNRLPPPPSFHIDSSIVSPAGVIESDQHDNAAMKYDMSQASIASNLDLNDSKTAQDILEAIDKLRKQRMTTIKKIQHTR